MPNKKVRDISSKSIFPSAQNVVDATVSYEQGDLLFLDPVTGLQKKLAAEADAATLLGVATETIVNGKLKRPYVTDVDGSAAISDIPGAEFGSVWKFIAKTGDAFPVGCGVFADPISGSRNVQTAVGTKLIGVYQGPAIASAVAGQEVEVLVGSRFPQDTLRF